VKIAENKFAFATSGNALWFDNDRVKKFIVYKYVSLPFNIKETELSFPMIKRANSLPEVPMNVLLLTVSTE
jgi:hypothetical protein